MSCDPLLLEHSLADRLSERDEETLAAHLATCEHCRERLQRLAGEVHEWTRIGQVLRTAARTPGTSFFCVGRNDESLAVSHTESDFDDDSYIDFAVNFLDPARRAGAIVGKHDSLPQRARVTRDNNDVHQWRYVGRVGRQQTWRGLAEGGLSTRDICEEAQPVGRS